MFSIDALVIRYKDIEAGKQWWIANFGCKQTALPDWDDPRPSDIALQLPGEDAPTILLTDWGAPEPDQRPMVFTNNIQKAHTYLSSKNITVGGIISNSGPEHFEIRDIEGNGIEVCS